MTTAIEFRGVSRTFGAVRAVDSVSFEIADGEFFAMLGPSGSGKTTCLRLIAGFEQPDAGAILVHGKPMQGVPPYDRPVNTVFQDYALFPHLSVLDNVAYGLMVRGMAKAERHRKAQAMLELVALDTHGPRRPSQLSGGQRQRVALARALVLEPEVLLLDEPLGALDLKLRQQMQGELKALQRQVGITFVFVTHDQDEALGMADRVAVFNQGRIEQIGTAEEVYERPATVFVAGFVGSSNIVDAATRRAPARPPAGVLAAAGADRRGCRGARSWSRARWSRANIMAPARAWTWRSTAVRCWSSTIPMTGARRDRRRVRACGWAGRPRPCSRCATERHDCGRFVRWRVAPAFYLALAARPVADLAPPAAAAAVAGRGLPRLAAGAARPQLLPARRVLGPDRLRVGHHAPMSSC